MTENSSRLSLPYIQPSQAQKHVTHNQALRQLDILVQMTAISDSQDSAPLSAEEGDCYLIPPRASGAWAGHSGDIALWQDGNWAFFAPQSGWRIFVLSSGVLRAFDGTDWQAISGAAQGSVDAAFESLSIGAETTEQQKLAVKTEKALWTAVPSGEDGSGSILHILNKETAAQDAGFIFQSDGQTRALVGLLGADDFRITTTKDNITFRDGLRIDAATACVSLPNLPRFHAYTNYNNDAPADQWIKIGINMAEFNDQGCFNPAKNVFRAPTQGSYYLAGQVMFKETTSNLTQLKARLMRNGTHEIKSSRAANTAPHMDGLSAVKTEAFVALGAGDEVELQCFGAAHGCQFAEELTFFWGYKIG